MNHRSEPEIIPPGREPKAAVTDEQLNQVARLLDDVFEIPGTGIRFGLDSIIGLIPGFGDLLTGAVSTLLLMAAWERGLPRVTIWRMVANIAVDTVVGSIPFFGDIFDVAWKANRRNYDLLVRESAAPVQRRQTWKDWLFLAGLVLIILALIAVPVALLTVLVHSLLE